MEPMEGRESLRCEECGRQIAHGYEAVSCGASVDHPGRLLCLRCYNREMAEYAGIDFEHPEFEPLRLTDAEGHEHLFVFATRLLGAQAAIEAYEEGADHGYRFQVLGAAQDVPKLLPRLVSKMRRALTWRHIVEEGRRRVGDDSIVRGRFEWDDETDGQLPLLVIDGEAVTWDELGRMLSCFEGWEFKIEIYDKSEER